MGGIKTRDETVKPAYMDDHLSLPSPPERHPATNPKNHTAFFKLLAIAVIDFIAVAVAFLDYVRLEQILSLGVGLDVAWVKPQPHCAAQLT